MLKHGGTKLQTVLHKISDMIITHHAKLPTKLNLSEIIVLFKNPSFINLLAKMYENSIYKIRTGNISIRRGVR